MENLNIIVLFINLLLMINLKTNLMNVEIYDNRLNIKQKEIKNINIKYKNILESVIPKIKLKDKLLKIDDYRLAKEHDNGKDKNEDDYEINF